MQELPMPMLPGDAALTALCRRHRIRRLALFGRKVDLRTADDLSPHFREEVLRQAQVAYAG